MKMYGALTRTEVVWAPENLLCKRLNIRNPYSDKKDPTDVDFEDPDEKQVLNKRVMDQLLMDLNPIPNALQITGNDGDDMLEMALINGPDEFLEEEVKVAVFVRPTMELLKSIFENSDDEDEDVEIIPIEVDVVVDNVLYDIPLPEEIVEVPVEVFKVPQPPPTFRPVFTKKADRVLVKKTPRKEVETSIKGKSKARSSLSFGDDEEEEEVTFDKSVKMKSSSFSRPSAADYL